MATGYGRVGYRTASGINYPQLRAQDVTATNGVTVETHVTNGAIHLTTAQVQLIANAIQNTLLAAANGVATLDANGKLVAAQIPAAITGKLDYRGAFNATTGNDDTGTAIPAPSAGNKGYYWICNVAATAYTPPGNTAPLAFDVGDWLVSNGATYDEIDNTTVDAIARAAAAAAQTTANLIDAAYCTDETDMAAKNLRTGAIVLMEVQNNTVDPPDTPDTP